MKYQKILEIVIKTYAIYLLVNLPFSIAGTLSTFTIDNSQFVLNVPLYKTISICIPFIHIFIACLLLLKADRLSKYITGRVDQDIFGEDENQQSSRLYFWITLMGLYFMVTSFASLVMELIRIPMYSGSSYLWSVVISHSFILVVGYFFTFKSKKCNLKIFYCF